MQAIITKYLGPTNSRGSRIKAIGNTGFAYWDWNHALNPDENHENAANAFIAKHKLNWKIHSKGSMPMNTPYAYAFVATYFDRGHR
jgi:hypothetical protein